MHGETTAGFFSLTWWLSVVLVGLLIHIAGGFLHHALDEFLRRWSGQRRSWSQARREKFQQQVDKLRDNPAEQQIQAICFVALLIVGLGATFLGLFFVSAGEFRVHFPTLRMKDYRWYGSLIYWFFTAGGGFLLFFGIIVIHRSVDMVKLIIAARNKKMSDA